MSGRLRFALEPVGPLDALARDWARFDAAPETSFFTSWLWIGTWLATLPAEVAPLALRAFDGDTFVGIAIVLRRNERRRMVISARQLHFNATGDPRFDCLTIEHNGFAHAGIAAAALWREAFAWFAETQDEELLIGGVSEDGTVASAAALAGLLHRVHPVPAFRMALDGPDFDPASVLSRNARQQLNRAMRLCAEAGELALDEAKTVEEALQYFAAMKELHIASWDRRGKAHSFANPHFERFHHALIAAGITRGAIHMLRIRAGESVLGYLYNFRHGNTVYAYQSGFDAADKRRVGYVCHALAIRHAARAGVTTYDFLAGDNRLKRSFATEEYAMGWHVLQRPLARFRAENALRAAKNAVTSRA